MGRLINQIMSFSKIVSNGQTGVGIGALDAAIHSKLPYYGYCPKGRKQEKGKRIPRKYNLTEMKSPYFIKSIEANILDSDATLFFFILGGQTYSEIERMLGFCDKYNKPALAFMVSEFFDEKEQAGVINDVTRWFSGETGTTPLPSNCVLNIVGTKESKSEGLEKDIKSMVVNIISAVNGKLSYPIGD